MNLLFQANNHLQIQPYNILLTIGFPTHPLKILFLILMIFYDSKKKVQSCTKYTLFNFISYVLLSPLNKAFVSLLYFLCIPKNWMEVVENTI